MDLHATEFDGMTFGMEVSTATPAYKRMMKNVTVQTVTLHRRYPRRMACVRAEDLACIMHEAAWLVRERKAFETVQFGEGQEYFILYD